MFERGRAEFVWVLTNALHNDFILAEQGFIELVALQIAFKADMAIFKTDLGLSDFLAKSHKKLAITVCSTGGKHAFWFWQNKYNWFKYLSYTDNVEVAKE